MLGHKGMIYVLTIVDGESRVEKHELSLFNPDQHVLFGPWLRSHPFSPKEAQKQLGLTLAEADHLFLYRAGCMTQEAKENLERILKTKAKKIPLKKG